ncbi:MAG: sulfatase-like hydrolase/transferase, partial [Thermoanaerobaculia bacterium]|nr:sulfatase-like hydrolase/transferase [Thermoanaerobaculia bacterium]
YGYAPAETPVLDRLAAEGLRFDQAMAAAPLTLPSHATLLSGRLPQHHGLRLNGAGSLPTELPTLASVLGAAGYRTGAFVGAFVLDRRFGLARGFEVYDDEIPRDPTRPEGLEAERPGHVVVDAAVAWLAQADPRPFLLWVHLFDAHAPYEPPEPFRSRHAGRPYDGEVAELDHQVGRLLAALEQTGRGGRTIVAVVADHGESLGDHGELTHGLLLYEPTVRVPLLLRGPGLPAGRTVAAPVSTADLAPTLAGLAGVPFPALGLDGRDLSADLATGAELPTGDLYAETQYPSLFGWSPLSAVRRGRFKYIDSSRPELYDLANDPQELRDLRTTERRTVADLAARLTELVRFSRTVAPGADDAETKARLASLGYVGGGAGGAPGSGRNPREAAELFREFEEAHWALLAGRSREAAQRLEKLVATDPGNPVFRASLGEAARKSGDLNRAAELYRQATAAAPRDPQNWYNLAVTLREAGRPREAAQALGEALRLDPGHAEAHNALGILHIFDGELPAARDQLARAVALDPRNAAAQNNLGNALRALSQVGLAERHYREAIRLAPRYADPLNGLGVLLVEQNRAQEALPLFDRALELAPGFHEVRLNQGVALQAAGDLAGAVAAYRSFLSAAAEDPQFTAQRRVARELVAQLSGSPPGRSTAEGR